jgi:hypothetical protein
MIRASQEFSFIYAKISHVGPPHVNNIMTSYWFPREYLKMCIQISMHKKKQSIHILKIRTTFKLWPNPQKMVFPSR